MSVYIHSGVFDQDNQFGKAIRIKSTNLQKFAVSNFKTAFAFAQCGFPNYLHSKCQQSEIIATCYYSIHTIEDLPHLSLGQEI